jgi:hypothetical protein
MPSAVTATPITGSLAAPSLSITCRYGNSHNGLPGRYGARQGAIGGASHIHSPDRGKPAGGALMTNPPLAGELIYVDGRTWVR